MKFLEKFELLSNYQHGFRQSKSTETATITFLEKIYLHTDKNEYVVALLFDLSKAFDTIDPDFVSLKISRLGIRGPLNQWITSFLTNRRFRIKVDGTFSETFDSTIGTPQGSVLGPLIFLLFINDLPDYIQHGTVLMYADDTSIIITDKYRVNVQEKVNLTLLEFSKWCSSNNLIINYNKTKCIEFRNKRRKAINLQIKFNNVVIELSKEAKLLGMIFDTHLDWSYHIEELCSRIGRNLFALRSLKNSLGIPALMTAYYANIHSLISYGVVLWGQSSDVDRVLVLQKRAIRIIFDLPYLASCRELFRRHRILTVTSVYIYKLLVYIHKSQGLYFRNSYYHAYPTRKNYNFCLPKPNHEFLKHSTEYAGCKLYNLLPPSTTTKMLTLNCFEKQLKQTLYSETFYTVNEFIEFLNNKNKSLITTST